MSAAAETSATSASSAPSADSLAALTVRFALPRAAVMSPPSSQDRGGPGPDGGASAGLCEVGLRGGCEGVSTGRDRACGLEHGRGAVEQVAAQHLGALGLEALDQLLVMRPHPLGRPDGPELEDEEAE